MSSQKQTIPQGTTSIRSMEMAANIVDQWGGLQNVVKVFSVLGMTPLTETKTRMGGIQLDLKDARMWGKDGWVNRIVVEVTASDYYRVYFIHAEYNGPKDEITVLEFHDEVDAEQTQAIVQELANAMRKSYADAFMTSVKRAKPTW